MSGLSSVHTHATLCDGADTLADMAKAAYQAGVRHYGVSCHSHTPAPLDQDNTLPVDMADYCAQVHDLQAQYAGKMDVLLGLEWDSGSDASYDGFDYWIGSVHNLSDKKTGVYYPIDWEMEHFVDGCNAMHGGDALGMVAQYYREVATVAQKKPTILGHFDLICKLNQDACLFDEESEAYRALALHALDAVDVNATVLEVNTGALSKYGRIYPSLFILEAWRKRGGRITLTADAHSASAIVAGYDQGEILAQKAGFSSQVVLTKDGWSTVHWENC